METKQQISLWVLIGMIFMMAVEQEYDELNIIKTFQDTMMRVRYSSIPVVVSSRNDFWWLRNEFAC
jgi:3-hydroxyacyl-CoA dehydrogenase